MAADLLLARKKNIGPRSGFRIAFLERGQSNANQSYFTGYVGLHHIVVKDKDTGNQPMVLTSAMVSSSLAYGGYGPEKAIDGLPSTYWCTGNGKDGNSDGTTFYAINFGKKVNVSELHIGMVPGYCCTHVKVTDLENQNSVLYDVVKGWSPALAGYYQQTYIQPGYAATATISLIF